MRNPGPGAGAIVDAAVEQALDVADRPLIVHAIFRLDVGGMENGLVNLINGLPSECYRHAIICVTQSSDFAERLTTEDVDIYELHKKEGKDPYFYLRFWRLIRELKPTILHTRNLGTLDLGPIAMLSRVPVRVHGEHGWDAGDPFGSSAKYRLLRRLCNLAVTEYVAVSRDIENWLRNVIHVGKRNVQQIYNGVDVDKFSPKGRSAELQFGRPGRDPVVIGTVGRLDRIKNFDLLLHAFAKLAADGARFHDTLRMVIVGDGPELQRLRNLASELGVQDIVLMPGKRTDIANLLRAMHLFVLPSRNEGISNTILESMSTGLPVIASDVGGNPELISDGENGALVPANDVDALAAAIERYLDDPALVDAHGAAARERAVRHFSLSAMVQSYQRMYDRMLSTRVPTTLH